MKTAQVRQTLERRMVIEHGKAIDMSEIIALFASFTGIFKMLIFEKDMTARAWLIYIQVVAVLFCVFVWAFGKAISSVAAGLAACGLI